MNKNLFKIIKIIKKNEGNKEIKYKYCYIFGMHDVEKSEIL